MASYDIGPRIGIEGESEFRKSLLNINEQIRTLGTEMAATTAAFSGNEKSQKSLKAQSEILKKEIEAQKEKVSQLSKAVKESTEKYGENDTKTLKWKQALNTAQAQLSTMESQLDDNSKALKNNGEETEKADKKWSGFGATLKATAAAVAAAAAAAGAAAVKLGKEVVSAYSEYEQLIGGVETLFGESADVVQKYAENAYKTAGLSANAYMETVTSFSASLLQSLDGDTEAAAKKADTAITDMADNANKMGTSIESLQNAYAGFAKGNYTMLDNLKLGYGGTKEEMARLLQDATALSGVQYDLSSYADIVDAIHVVQENLGIAGATALEASTTIEGSIGALSASFQNLITGFGNADADVGKLAKDTISAFQTVVKNVTPIIQNIVKALPDAVAAVVDAVGGMLPDLLDTAMSIFSQVLETLIRLLPELIPVAVSAVMTIGQTLVDNLPTIIDGGVQLVLALVRGIGDSLPELLPAAVDAVVTVAEGLIDNIDEVIDAGIQLVTGMARGLIDALPKLLETAPVLITELVDAIVDNLPMLIDAAIQLVVMLGSALIDNLPLLLESAAEIVFKIAEGIVQSLGIIIEKGAEIVQSVKDGFMEKIDDAKNWGKDMIQNFKDGITEKWDNLKHTVEDVANSVKNFLGFSEPKEGPLSNFHTFAPDMMKLFIKGVKDNEQALRDQIASSFDVSDMMPGIGDVTIGSRVGAGVVSLDAGSLAAVRGGSAAQTVTINFTGSLAQLARILQPEIQTAADLNGAALIV